MPGIDAYTVLMLHMDGADTSTTFTDKSYAGANSPHTVTANGNAQIDTAQSKFGGASGLFDGTGDYLSLADSADWAFGTGDFTIDIWVRFPSLPADTFRYSIVSHGTDDNNWYGFELKNDAGVYAWRFQLVQNAVIVFSVIKTTTLSLNTWYHVALVRSGNNWYVFQAGSQVGTTDTHADSIPDFTGLLRIGYRYAGPQTDLNGWLDELRISKGVARWTSNFTPPTAAYTQDAVVSGSGASGSTTSCKRGAIVAGAGLSLASIVTLKSQVVQGAGASQDSFGKLLSQSVHGAGLSQSTVAKLFSQVVHGSGLSQSSFSKIVSQVVNGAGHGVGIFASVTSQIVTGAGASVGAGLVRVSQAVQGYGASVAAGAVRFSQVVRGYGASLGAAVVHITVVVYAYGASATSVSTQIGQVVSGYGDSAAVAAGHLSQIVNGYGHSIGAKIVVISQVVRGYGLSTASLSWPQRLKGVVSISKRVASALVSKRGATIGISKKDESITVE